MPKTTYDTRFFIEHYYSKDPKTIASTTREIREERDKAISSVVIHEVYRFTLKKDGREVAILRADLMEKDFAVIPVDEGLAVASAELRQKYDIPMADSIIAATAISLKSPCVTDDTHITGIREAKTRWITTQ